jgi:hypothetical protein
MFAQVLRDSLRKLSPMLQKREQASKCGSNEEEEEKKLRDSAVGIATGYGLNDRGVGVRVPVGARIFSSPHRPNWFWGSLSLPWAKAAGA